MGPLVLFCVVLVVAVQGQELYDSKYDNINLDDILSNDRLLKRYVDCLLAGSDAKCTEDGKALRRYLGEGLSTDCAKCTEKQKSGAQKAVKYLVNNKKDWWDQIENKYDPTGSFLQKHPELKA